MVAFGQKDGRPAMRVFLLFIKYNWDLLEHKCHVLWHGCITVGGIPLWNLIVHDLSKYEMAEYLPRFRYKYLKSIKREDVSWLAALSNHWGCNKHHWEFWYIQGRASPMPEVYVREMVADWIAVNRKKSRKDGRTLALWLLDEYPKMHLHESTLRVLIRVLGSLGIHKEEWVSTMTPRITRASGRAA